MNSLKHKKLQLVFILIICLILCSCAKNTKQDISVPATHRPEYQTAYQNNDFTQSSASPPEILVLNNFNQYIEFKKSLELSDEDFDFFIKTNDFDMNGINSKEDVRAICAKIDAFLLPNTQKFTLTAMTVYVDRNECLFNYKTPEDITCSYLVYFDKDEITAFNLVKNNSDFQAVSDLRNNVGAVYYVNSGSNDGMEAYYTIIDDCLVLFRVYDASPSTALELFKSANFDALAAQ